MQILKILFFSNNNFFFHVVFWSLSRTYLYSSIYMKNTGSVILRYIRCCIVCVLSKHTCFNFYSIFFSVIIILIAWEIIKICISFWCGTLTLRIKYILFSVYYIIWENRNLHIIVKEFNAFVYNNWLNIFF